MTAIFSEHADAKKAASTIEAILYSLSRSPLGVAYVSVLNAIEWTISDEPLTISHKGRHARVNPKWFCAQRSSERIYWLLHVAAHVVASHTVIYRTVMKEMQARIDNEGRAESVLDLALFNHALDLNAEAMLREDAPQIDAYLSGQMKTPRTFITFPKSAAFYPDKAGLDPYALFQWLKSEMKESQPPKGGDQHEPGEGQAEQQDADAPPGKPNGALTQEDAQKLMDSFSAERSMGKSAQGDAATSRALFSATPNPLPWNRILATLLRSAVNRQRTQTTWKRISPRAAANGLILPGRKADPTVGRLIVVLDTSGSIRQRELAEFAGHVSNMLEDVQPAGVVVLWVDDEVREVQEFKPDQYGNIRTLLKPMGGGGTDMCAALTWVRNSGQAKPVGMIVLTDGWTPFPDRTEGYPIWWIVSTEARVPPTAGTTIRFRLNSDDDYYE